MQEAVYRIAQTADECETLDDLYAAIHGIVQGVMPAENFYIALYDADQDFRFKKAEMDTARYVFETQQKEAPKAAATSQTIVKKNAGS